MPPKKQLNRSTKLRKYGSVYAKAAAKKPSPTKKKSSPTKKKSSPTKKKASPTKKKSPKPRTKRKPPRKSPKRALSAYQKFVKAEIKKEKYASLPPTRRLGAIAAEWRKQKS